MQTIGYQKNTQAVMCAFKHALGPQQKNAPQYTRLYDGVAQNYPKFSSALRADVTR